MDKIQKAQQLADQLLDEATIRQVGDDKGALKDKPESIQKSEDDLEDYVEMEEGSKIETMVAKIATYLGEDFEHFVEKFETSNTITSMQNRSYDKARNKQGERKFPSWLNRVKDGIKGNDALKRRGVLKGKIPTTEADQVATAQQKDTLFDKEERIEKDSGKLKPTITTEPTTEAIVAEASLGAKIQRGIARNDRNLRLGNAMDPKAKANAKKRKEDKEDKVSESTWLDNLKDWGKKKMNKKRDQGLALTQKRDKALKDTKNS